MSRDPLWMEGDDFALDIDDEEEEDEDDPDSQHDSWYED